MTETESAQEDGAEPIEVSEDEIGAMLDIYDYLHSAQKFGMGFIGFVIGTLFGHVVVPQTPFPTYAYLGMTIVTGILGLVLLTITPQSLAKHTLGQEETE